MGCQLYDPAALPPGKRPDNHHTAGWVGLGVDLDGFRKIRNFWGLNHGSVGP